MWISGIPAVLQPTAKWPGPAALTAQATSGSLSARSTAVYAAALIDIGPLLPQRVGNRFLPGDVDLGAIDARNPVIRRPHSSAQLMSDLTGGAEHKKFHRETSRSIIEMARQFREHRLPAILVRQQRFFLLDRPSDGERGIVPPKPAVVLGRIIAVHLVDDLGVGLERAEPVGKPLGNIALVVFLGAEHDTDMMPVGW